MALVSTHIFLWQPLMFFFLPAGMKRTIKRFFHRIGLRDQRQRSEWIEAALISAGGKEKKSGADRGYMSLKGYSYIVP
jgi:hypothetical protein